MRNFVPGIESFLLNPFFSLFVAVVLVVISWRVSGASASNAFLMASWFFLAIALFRGFHRLPIAPRVLWTMAVASVVGLLLHQWLWTVNPVTAVPAATGMTSLPAPTARYPTASEIASEVARHISTQAVGATDASDATITLRPITRDDATSLIIPLNTEAGDPIPPHMSTDVNSPMANRSRWLGSLARYYIQIGHGDLSDATFLNDRHFIDDHKPKNDHEQKAMLASVLQYYVIEQISVLQGDSFGLKRTLGSGDEAISKLGIHPPDRIKMSGSDFATAIAGNRLAPLPGHAYWMIRQIGYWLPRSSTPAVANRTLPDGHIEYVFSISRAGVFKLDFTVRDSRSFGPLSNGLPSGYRAPADVSPELTKPFLFDVICHFEFYRTSSTDLVQQEDYTRWAESLIAGVKERLTN